MSHDPRIIPIVAQAGTERLRANAVYVRRGAATEEASHEELQRLISRRIETMHSSSTELTLESHLSQLKVLYDQFNPRMSDVLLIDFFESTRRTYARNHPNFPAEDFLQFVGRMITVKQGMIEAIVLYSGASQPD